MLPLPAMADIMAPPGFEDLPKVYDTGFPQNVIDLNKQCILFIEQTMHNIGAGQLSEGLTIIAWTLILRFLCAPFYEITTKEVARYAKSKHDFL